MLYNDIMKGVINMSSEDALNGAKTIVMFLDGYINTVGREIGMEKALSLFTETCEFMGAMRGAMAKQQSGIKQFDAKAAWSLLLKSLKDTAGFTYEILEESPQRVIIRDFKCPFYEGARMLGIDDKTIETNCRAGSMRTADAAAKQLNPNLNVRVRKFRSTPDGFCDEEIALG